MSVREAVMDIEDEGSEEGGGKDVKGGHVNEFVKMNKRIRGWKESL